MSARYVPQSLLGRIAAVFGAAVALVFVASQMFLSGIGEAAIEDRLTRNGGVATASLSAMPAARLLWGSGDRVEIDAAGLELDVSTATDPVVLDDLDRFDDVQIVMRDSQAGPVELDDFILTRTGDEPYSLRASGASSASALAEFGAEALDFPGADILGGIMGFATGGQELDVELDMVIESDDGRIRVIDGGGEVAGIPTGPLAAIITSAITIDV